MTQFKLTKNPTRSKHVHQQKTKSICVLAKPVYVAYYLAASLSSEPLKCQAHKMVKHTQKIRQQLSRNCLSLFDTFLNNKFN